MFVRRCTVNVFISPANSSVFYCFDCKHALLYVRTDESIMLLSIGNLFLCSVRSNVFFNKHVIEVQSLLV